MEKPGWGQVFSDTINTGIYVLEPEIFDHIPEGRSVDFSGEVFPAVLQAGLPLYGYVADGYWEDVGATAAYLKAHEDILDGKVDVDVAGFELRPRHLHRQGLLHRARRSGSTSPAFVGGELHHLSGRGARGVFDRGRQHADRGPGRDAALRHRRDSYLGPAVRVEGAVLGRSCDLGSAPGSSPAPWSGRDAFIGAHAEVRSDVKVYPGKVVEAGAQVNASIVWESGGSRTLFGPEGVQGIANVDISPELAVRLAGAARASGFEKGSSITASRDTSRVARVLKRALMVGCNSVGVNVNDLELATVPVTQHHVRRSGNRAGLGQVRLSPDDPQSVVIRFFNEPGVDCSKFLTSAAWNALAAVRSSAASPPAKMGTSTSSPRTIELYTEEIVEALELSPGDRAPGEAVLDLSYGAANFVMPNLLSKVHADVLSINPYARTPGMMALNSEVR